MMIVILEIVVKEIVITIIATIGIKDLKKIIKSKSENMSKFKKIAKNSAIKIGPSF